jgi:hypothetical protein
MPNLEEGPHSGLSRWLVAFIVAVICTKIDPNAVVLGIALVATWKIPK